MMPKCWLEDEIVSHEWNGSNTSWERGGTYNLWLEQNKLVGRDGQDLVFRGVLGCPSGQLMTCCARAGGESHECSKVITKAAEQLVEWKIPQHYVPDECLHSFPHVALQHVLYDGVRIFTRYDDSSCDSQSDQCLRSLDAMCTEDEPVQGSNQRIQHVPMPHPLDGVSCVPLCSGEPQRLVEVADGGGNLFGETMSGDVRDGTQVHGSHVQVTLPHQSSGGVHVNHECHDYHAMNVDGIGCDEGCHVCSDQSLKIIDEHASHGHGKWGLGDLAPQEVKVLRFHLESEVSQVFPKMHPLPTPSKWSLVELFAGGFAGWKQATGAMNKLQVPWDSTHAVELREEIAQLYCKTVDIHRAFKEDDEVLKGLFPLQMNSTLGNTMFCGDVRNPDWVKLVPWSNHVIAAVSAPCPPWSRSSAKDGLHHAEGRLSVSVAVAMKFLQPLAIAIENVDTMRDHRHFKCVRDMFEWAGYRLVWECVADLRKTAPISRKRWLAVFIRHEGEIRSVQMSDFLEMPQPTLETHKILMKLPWEHEKDLTLTGDLLDVYSDVRYATRQMRTHFFREQGQLTSRDVMKLRVKHGRSVLATFVASYTTQHRLPEQHLRSDGLFAELIDGRLGIRFFSPYEIASAHGVLQDLCLPADIHSAHLVVGNGIAVQHSVLALSHARNYVDTQTRCHPQEMVLMAMKGRLHAENTEFVDDGAFRWLRRKVDEVLAAQPDPDENDADGQMADTDLDTCTSEEDVPPTVPFHAECQILCFFPDSTHVFTTRGDVSLRQVLQQHDMLFALDFTALDESKNKVQPDEILSSDTNITFVNLLPFEIDLVEKKAAWRVFQPGTIPTKEVSNLASRFHLPQLRGYDVAGNPIMEYAFNDVCRFTLMTTESIDFDRVWDLVLRHETSLKAKLADIRLILPICRVANDHIAMVASVGRRCEAQCSMFQKVLARMQPILHACGWFWKEEEGKILGRFVPFNDCAAPVSSIHWPLARCLLDGVLSAFQEPEGIPFRLKLDGGILWDKPLSASMRLDHLDAVLQCCLHICGFSPVTWIHGGKRILMDDRVLGSLKAYSSALNLSMIQRTRGGGGAKTETWKEIKNQLAKLMIHKGWSLVGLDEITSEWVEKIGLPKLQNVFKTQLSVERKWHTILDYAKNRNLKVMPDDPVRMRAARTIQQALRKNKTTALVASRFQIAEGFFTTHNDKPLPVVQNVNLKSTGICLMDWEQAASWLSRTLPITTDELAILTLSDAKIPDGFPVHKELTFPAIDDRQRPVILRGHIWQLGEQQVKWTTHEQAITQSPTIVLACTVWRDEVSESLWEDLGKSLVKTTFALMDDIDCKSRILQVWGRSFRDTKTRTDPSEAHSAQFHCRIFVEHVEEILRTSGRNHVYLTPKSDNHMSHPGWSMLWFEDRVAVDIAANKATEHSGIARVKGKYALRVRACVLTQIAKEIKCDNLAKDNLQIRQLFKIQPVPVGITQEQLVQWAAELQWKVRVLKKLGRDAYLLGTDAAPPHPHLSLNGTVVLLKQVNPRRENQSSSALVAGPRQNPVRETKEPSMMQSEVSSDAWAAYRMQNGLPLGSAGNPAPKPSMPVDQTLEGPIAQKFAAIEQRIQQHDQGMKQLTQECQQLTQTVHSTQSQVAVVDQKVSGLETNMQAFQRDMQSSVEKAIGRGMASQDKKLDQKFDAIMKMLSAGTSKRKETEPDEDEHMSPVKQP
eukprot:Skav209791  [mRNA]  locus=scaffold1201:13767:18878:- [translate_table: standard]